MYDSIIVGTLRIQATTYVPSPSLSLEEVFAASQQCVRMFSCPLARRVDIRVGIKLEKQVFVISNLNRHDENINKHSATHKEVCEGYLLAVNNDCSVSYSIQFTKVTKKGRHNREGRSET